MKIEIAKQQDTVVNSNALIPMTVILMLAFALGAHGLNLDPIWADELASITFFGAFDPPYNPSQVIESLRTFSPDQAPLYFVLGAQWARIAGWSQFALRAPSLFAGALAIAWLFRFTIDVLNRRAALAAAFLMSTNAFVILYFHDIRMYSMHMALGIMHTWLYWRLAHGHRVSRQTWFLFVLSTTVLFFTHNFSAVLFAGLGIYHLFFAREARRWLKVMLGWAVGGALFLPYAPFVISGLRFNQSVTSTPLPTLDVAYNLLYLLVNGVTLLWIPLILGFGFVVWRRRNLAIIRLAFVPLMMIALILLINWRFAIITGTRMRYFLLVWYLLVMLLAYVVTSMPHWRVATAAFLSIWCIAGFQFDRSGEVVKFAGLMARDRQYPPLQDYVYHLVGKTQPRDFLVGFSDEDRVSRVSYNSSNSTSDYYLGTQLGIDGVFLHSHLKRYRLESDVRVIVNAHPQVLLAHNPLDVPANLAKTIEVIQQEFVPCPALVDEPKLQIRKYTHPLMACAHEAAPIAYDNGVKLVDRAVSFDHVANGVRALTWWEIPDETMLDDYNISLQLLSKDWQNVRQIDRHLYDKLLPWNVIEMFTTDLPAGEYRLMLVLYRRDTGETIGGVESADSISSDIIPLFTFEIPS